MSTYTHGHHESVLRSHRWRTAENSAAYLLDSLKPHMKILDVGCGPGTITADLAARVPAGEVLGIDTAPAIIEQARELAEELELSNLRFATGDVYALDYPDDTFCVVHAHQVLQHLADPVRALEEMRRVCKPAGYIAFRDADYGGMGWYPRLPGLDDWVDLYRRVARANGGDPDAGRRLHSWARAVELEDVAVSSATWYFATQEERAWWSSLWAERTVASSYAAMAVDGGHATTAELERIADTWREWAAADGAWFSILHGEVRARKPVTRR